MWHSKLLVVNAKVRKRNNKNTINCLYLALGKKATPLEKLREFVFLCNHPRSKHISFNFEKIN